MKRDTEPRTEQERIDLGLDVPKSENILRVFATLVFIAILAVAFIFGIYAFN